VENIYCVRCNQASCSTEIDIKKESGVTLRLPWYVSLEKLSGAQTPFIHTEWKMEHEFLIRQSHLPNSILRASKFLKFPNKSSQVLALGHAASL
jgi:hypothetical protein